MHCSTQGSCAREAVTPAGARQGSPAVAITTLSSAYRLQHGDTGVSLAICRTRVFNSLGMQNAVLVELPTASTPSIVYRLVVQHWPSSGASFVHLRGRNLLRAKSLTLRHSAAAKSELTFDYHQNLSTRAPNAHFNY